ncbi:MULTISPECIES: 2-isopropylmalate synthase [unclassified Sphingopyxis]|jgi:2-isopropylmalate synthase|uniref:2-isopropylmalate synthase n=1 Tax=unclassified Sphingopyxis TaxID=2614943 RepID=UPI0006C40D42|nr:MULTISPECIES: 2-isopropylmalate synthase [unclassified Sphingopyxis]USI75529.1 2-isopropylmalate synthase [Sphingopyxis sp. USTB-05]GAO77963.1 2-isopropylmalate synthase [Sphingopyxis sp. C-1]
MTMLRDPSAKYSAFPQVPLANREWPTRVTTKAPIWLSTDLRDGNQSLIDPMDAEKKTRFFDLLVKCGFKEIEVGFPASGATDFDYIQGLVRNGRIPADVTPQVLTQSRADLIRTSFDSLEGAKTAIVHVYNAVSPAWRKIVFGMEMDEIKGIAIEGAKQLRDNAARLPGTDWRFEYSPETFSTAELDFSIACCEAVMDILQPTTDKPIILNLPATVEASTANIYADQIEYFCKNLPNRDRAIISLHTHNDRGTGVAAAELGLLAGADRVEGCLFGNGERTGNTCLVTIALNMYTQGVDPELDFSNIDEVIQTVEYCNRLPVHPRHPYGGELVYTAFSGSHQDAIKKGFAARERQNDQKWEVPYLPIDPADLGRSYEAVIRVNSQSGKGGVAWVLEQDKGLKLPKKMQASFSHVVQALADETSRELGAEDIWGAFDHAYLVTTGKRFQLVDWSESHAGTDRIFAGKLTIDGTPRSVSGRGNGLMSSVIAALAESGGPIMDIVDYSEHAIGQGSNVQAAAYVECRTADGRSLFGCGLDTDVATASVRAILSAANGA